MPAKGRIFIVGNQKGGVGKTTIAVNLAALWGSQGRRVLYVDADPQESGCMWVGEQGISGADIVRHPAGSRGLGQLLKNAALEYDAIVVDLPPGLTAAATHESIEAADLLLIPVQPSGLDIAAAIPYVELARGHGKKTRLVLNRQSRAKRMRAEVRGALAVTRVPVCKSELGNRVAFADCVIAGTPVAVYEPGGLAAAEVTALGAEVWRAH